MVEMKGSGEMYGSHRCDIVGDTVSQGYDIWLLSSQPGVLVTAADLGEENLIGCYIDYVLT